MGTRFVVIGLGQIGQELLQRLSKGYELTCVDVKAASGEKLAELGREDAAFIHGDATSRLVLESAMVDDADAVIVTLIEERTNLEVVRVLREHFNPRRIITVGMTMEGREALEAQSVEVENIFEATAMEIRNLIEAKSKSAHAIGLGKDEILEVEVHHNSRLANKTLGSLDPIRWRVGIVYRDGNIVIPRPGTVLKPKDKVVILGDPSVLKTVSEILTFSFSKFPLEYGTMVVACLAGDEDEKYADEINYLFSVFPVERLVVVREPESDEGRVRGFLERLEVKNVEVKKSHFTAVERLWADLRDYPGKTGMVIVPDSLVRSRFNVVSAPGKKIFMRDMVHMARCPVLVARGTFPYERMCFPTITGMGAVTPAQLEHLVGSALEVSQAISNEVTALHVKPSEYIAGEEETKRFQENRKTVSDMAVLHRMKVQSRELEGNPIKAVLGALEEFNLLLLNAPERVRKNILANFLNPDTSWNVARRTRVSTMLLPAIEEAL